MGPIQTLKTVCSGMKLITELVEIMFDYCPVFFDKIRVKPIWPKRFVSGEAGHNCINFHMGERF
jgi:hypothetical protein